MNIEWVSLVAKVSTKIKVDWEAEICATLSVANINIDQIKFIFKLFLK